jgi:hypothetical protein
MAAAKYHTVAPIPKYAIPTIRLIHIEDRECDHAISTLIPRVGLRYRGSFAQRSGAKSNRAPLIGKRSPKTTTKRMATRIANIFGKYSFPKIIGVFTEF